MDGGEHVNGSMRRASRGHCNQVSLVQMLAWPQQYTVEGFPGLPPYMRAPLSVAKLKRSRLRTLYVSVSLPGAAALFKLSTRVSTSGKAEHGKGRVAQST